MAINMVDEQQWGIGVVLYGNPWFWTTVLLCNIITLGSR